MVNKTTLNVMLMRFRILGLPKYMAVPIVKQLSVWLNNSGPEWTVTRLKALKLRYIHILADVQVEGEWDGIALRNGIPKGPFRPLFSPRYTAQHKGRKIALSVLDCYTMFVSASVTPKQWHKFSTSVCQPEENFENENHCTECPSGYGNQANNALVDEVVSTLNYVVTSRIKIPERPRVRNILEYPVSSERYSPSMDGPSCPETRLLDTLSCLWKSELCKAIFIKYPSMNRALGPLLDLVVSRFKEPEITKLQHSENSQPALAGTSDFVGKVSFLQESGFKLRAVANPFRIFQLGLSSLGIQLYRTLRTLPWDCTFNQDKADEEILQHLAKGTVISCFDLSDASNNIPLDEQLMLLHRLGCNPSDVSLFGEVSTSPWLIRNPLSNKWETIRWTKGQPLGLISSFASFALWHGALLRAIELCLKKRGTFYVLGDDVIIFDVEVASVYQLMAHHFRIPISQSKSFQSSKVASFAGKLFVGNQIYKSLKWRFPSDRSFVDVARMIGKPDFRLFRPRQRKVLKAIMEYPYPFGLGLNPHGKTLSERYKSVPLCLMEEPEDLIPKAPTIRRLRTLVAKSTEFSMKHVMNEPLVRDWFLQASRDRPDPLNCIIVKDRIISSTGIESDIFTSDSDSTLNWTSLVKSNSDPRGPTTLEVFEKKLSMLPAVSDS